jgi:hypothetical protein
VTAKLFIFSIRVVYISAVYLGFVNIMPGQHDNFIALLQRTTDDLLKNRLHSSLVRQIVIQDIEEVFRHSLKGKIKKLTSV